MTKEDRKMIKNPQLRDNISKLIFGDNILCAQFLRDYADLEVLRHVQPEDIEDVSERYVPLYSTERESYNMDMDEDKTENAVSKIKERKMGVLFEGVRENFEAARKRDIEEAVEKAVKETAEKNREQSQREMEILKYIFKLFRDGYSESQIKEALQNKYSLSVEQAEEQYRKVMED